MASFLTKLFGSVFTPGPTPTLIVATNVSFAALQLCLLVLLILTYSIHFAILSLLSAGLWWAINWFVTELQAATQKEQEAKHLREIQRERDDFRHAEDSGTETEAAETMDQELEPRGKVQASLRPERGFLRPESAQDTLRRRTSTGEGSGDLSTDSEWDKVEDEGDRDR